MARRQPTSTDIALDIHPFWHDSKLRALRILRNDALDEVLLDLELRGMPGQELTPMTIVLEDAVLFFSDIDLQGKPECSDDISSAKCQAKIDLMTSYRMSD